MILTNWQKVAVIFISLFLAIGAFFMLNVELPDWSYLLSSVNVLLFACPVFWVTKKWIGWQDALILFAVLGIFALLLETNAIITGFPYGHFGYSELLGYKFFGYVPWTVGFAWTPLVLAAFAISANLFDHKLLRVASTALILIIFDLTLDAGAVLLGFWKYENGGIYYGVPFLNFVGWAFSGALGAILMEIFLKIFKPLLPTPAQLISSSFFIIIFWTSIAFFGNLIIPTIIGILTLIGLSLFYLKFAYRFDEMLIVVDDENVPLATAPKLGFHHDKTPLHRAFSIFLFNGQGELLLQQRSFAKKTWGGVWSNSCCGHQVLHEKIEATAKKRVKYELGISVNDLKIILPDFRYYAEKDGVVENEICPVLVGFTDKNPIPNPAEVNSTEWVKWDDFLDEINQPICRFSPWAIEEVRLLAENKEFINLIEKHFS